MVVYILVALLIVAVVAGSLAVERFMNGTRNAAFWWSVAMLACVLAVALIVAFALVFARWAA